MTITKSFVTVLHSAKKNQDYLKFCLVCEDSTYSGFCVYDEYLHDYIRDADELDIVDINYKSALLLIDDKRLILNKIF